MKIPCEGIEGEQEDGKHDHPRIPPVAYLIFLFEQVGNCGTEEEYLEACHDTGRNFKERVLMKERIEEDTAAGHCGKQAQENRKKVPAHGALLGLQHGLVKWHGASAWL